MVTMAPLIVFLASWLGSEASYSPLPKAAKLGQEQFMKVAAKDGNIETDMAAKMQSNPLQFTTLTDFWCAWDLADRPRKLALLIDDMQVEYEPYVRGILPQTKLLLEEFRRAGLPVFWSTWWRWGPDDGYFNSMDRFYGPKGYRTAGNALYNHKPNGGDVLAEIKPESLEEMKRVMHKSYSLSMFDERPMKWLVPDNQGTLHEELQKLGVDTVVQVGAWTDDCIISTAFQAFSLQYDVVVVEDGVSTASKQHFNAIEVLRGAAAKVMLADRVAEYLRQGQPVLQDRAHATERGVSTPAAKDHKKSKLQLDMNPTTFSAASEAQLQPAIVLSGPALLLVIVVLACVGPCCFVAGWILQAKFQQQQSSERLMLG